MHSTNTVRIIHAGIRRRLPVGMRSLEDFYFFSFASCSAAVCLFALSPLLIYIDQFSVAITSAVCGLFSLISLIVWRLGVSLYVAQSIYQFSVILTILFNAYHSGGVASPVMVWMGMVPLLPIFSAGSSPWRYTWLLVSFTSVIAMYWLQREGIADIPMYITPAELALSACMIGLLCITQIMLVMTVDSANSQTIRNITKRNQALNRLTRDLHVANLHKDQFLATVSHEMRTPLNAVMGYLGLLKTSENIPTVAASYIQGAQNSAAHLLTVINDLLDFSQIQENKLVFSPQTIDLHKKLHEIYNTLAPKAAEQGLSYTIHLSSEVPQWVCIDPHRLAQILLNILGNALKFTRVGSISTYVYFEADEIKKEPSGNLRIEIRDTGVGIAPEFIEQIFKPFFQLDSNRHQDNALRGNGLGLAITRSLIQNLGGYIDVQSVLKTGSTFEIVLPIQLANAPSVNPVTSTESQTYLNEVELLIVDDHATNRLVAAATIKRALPKARISEAKNGKEAIERMKAHCYDLVLMDLIMPDFSGTEVVQIIRSECEAPFRDVPVIALTANAGDEAVKECLNVGILELLPKPFDREVLIHTILKYTKSSLH
jgi:signal transduction histidine kinase/CheY-like chemotaxis protein